jgi:hypothetical protein
MHRPQTEEVLESACNSLVPQLPAAVIELL